MPIPWEDLFLFFVATELTLGAFALLAYVADKLVAKPSSKKEGKR